MAKKIGPAVIRTAAGLTQMKFFVKLGEDDGSLPLRTKKVDGKITTSGGQDVTVLANPYGQPIGFETPEEAVEQANKINHLNGK